MVFLKRKSFTLLELLIAVSIFSGLAILSLGIFARSASSSIKTNQSRARTEVARKVVDQVAADLRLAYLDAEVGSVHSQAPYPCVPSNPAVKGYDFSDKCVVMVLRYPKDPPNTYIWKMYLQDGATGVLSVSEKRNCTLSDSARGLALSCPNQGGQSELVGEDSDLFTTEARNPLFSGLSPARSIVTRPVADPFIKISVTVKPKDMTGLCSDNPGSCYTVTTTINSGGAL